MGLQRVAQVFLIVLFATACGSSKTGGDGGTGGTTGGGALPLDSLAERYAAVFCRAMHDCCPGDWLMVNPFAGANEEECRAGYAALVTLAADSWAESVDAGRSCYNGDAMAACVNRIEQAGCDASEEDVDCLAAFTPLVSVGGACDSGLECISSRCINQVQGIGTCAAPLANGASCMSYADCASGSCAGGITGGSCSAKVAEGQACSEGPDCLSETCNPTTAVCAPEAPPVCR